MSDFFKEIAKNLALKQVGIQEFAESEEYCGKRLYPRQLLLLKLIFLEELTGKEEDILTHWIDGGRGGKEIVISPMIRERVVYLRGRGFPHFREILLVGGRRSSKGFVTGIAMAKRMYDTLQLHDPGLHYGIEQDKEIYFSCVASSQDQAKKFQYADLSSTIGRCRAMDDYVTKVQELEFTIATEADKQRLARMGVAGRKMGRDISKLRGNALAANASTVRGSATMAICFDEMAWMQQEGESNQTAAAVYDAVTPSLAQFGKDAMIFCNSSPYTKVGKFYQRYEDAMRIIEGTPAAPMTFVLQFPSWGLFEGWQTDPKRRFRKAITASPDWDPEEEHHSDEDRDSILLERDEERKDPDKYKVERRGEFAEVIDAFLRPEMVDRAYEGRPTRDEGFVTLRTNWETPYWEYKYKAHLDPSSTTAGFGFSLGHIERFEDPNLQEEKDHVIFDIVHRWMPDEFPERVIDWEIVLQDIVRWIRIFQPFEITFDQFQSQAPIQWLNKWLREQNMTHIRVYEKVATAQHNWNRANVFRTALYQGLVHIPADSSACSWSALELKNLQQINTAGRFPRIDKQEIGPVQTKDMADCIMEVTDTLIGDTISSGVREALGDMAPALGAQGGYQIGGRDNRLDSLYSRNHGSHTFREQKRATVAGPNSSSPSDKVREQLSGLTAARSGSWRTRNTGRGGRSRGF